MKLPKSKRVKALEEDNKRLHSERVNVQRELNELKHVLRSRIDMRPDLRPSGNIKSDALNLIKALTREANRPQVLPPPPEPKTCEFELAVDVGAGDYIETMRMRFDGERWVRD